MAFTYVQDPTWRHRTFSSFSADFAVFLAYEISYTDTTYTLTLKAGNVCKQNNVGCTGFKLKVTGTGKTEKTVSSKSYYSTDAVDNRVVYINNWTWTWPKETTSQAKTVKATLSAANMTNSVVTLSSSVTTVPALATHTVSYNMNGGSGSIADQTKYDGDSLTISSTVPTKQYYTFDRWNTASDGTGTSYSPGDTYSANADVTLYAQWTPNRYSIIYDANGGNGSATGIKIADTNLTLNDGTGFSKANHHIAGWNTASDGTGTSYSLSGTYSANASATLYAVWDVDYIYPSITNLKCFRVAYHGSSTETDDGEWIRVEISYIGASVDGGAIRRHSDFSISVVSATQMMFGSMVNMSSSPVSADYGPFSPDESCKVTVTLTDHSDSTKYVRSVATVSTATYPIDLVGDDTKVYMGVMTPAKTNKSLSLNEDVYLRIGSAYRRLIKEILPIGRIDMFGGDTVPSGWLLCDGSEVSQSTYSDLYAVIGDRFGTPVDNTKFVLPDLRDSYPVGVGTDHSIGDTGGANSTTLTIDNLPAHDHGSASLTGSFQSRKWGSGGMFSNATGIVTIENSTSTGNTASNSGSSTNQHLVTINASHTHNSVGKTNPDSFTNEPQYVAVNYIIYAGV